MKQIKQTSAIFDMDGTLVDSMYMWAHAGTGFFRDLGFNITQEVEDKMRVMSLYQTCEMCVQELGATQTADELLAGMWDKMGAFYRNEVELKPGVLAYLDKLKAEGVDMYIATATDRPLVEIALERTGIGHYFKGLITCAEAGIGKGEPKIFMDALSHLNGDVATTVVYEDSWAAIQTAKKAGFTVVGIEDDEARMHKDKIQSMVDVYIQSFEELV